MTRSGPYMVALTGGVGVGKTTLGRQLAEGEDHIQFFEDVPTDNPFFSRFYEDMRQWAFHSRISFLAMKTNLYRLLDPAASIILIDRSVHELDIFAKLQHEMGNLADEEYYTYKQIFQAIVDLAPPIDLFIHVFCSENTALDRIMNRDRREEQRISSEYWSHLLQRYQEFVLAQQEAKIIEVSTDSPVDIDGLRREIEQLAEVAA